MNRFNFCPKCGTPQPQAAALTPFQCGSCHFTYYQNSATAVAGILAFEDEILFTRRAKDPGMGKLGLPGGFVDAEEDLESALQREAFEEVGIQLTEWQYLCSAPNQYWYKDVLYHTCDAVFFCQLAHKPDLVLQQEEVRAAIWIKQSEIVWEDIAFPSLRAAVQTFVTDRRHTNQ